MIWVFAYGSGHRDSILDRVISKTEKMILAAYLLYIVHYMVLIKGEWSNPGKGMMTS